MHISGVTAVKFFYCRLGCHLKHHTNVHKRVLAKPMLSHNALMVIFLREQATRMTETKRERKSTMRRVFRGLQIDYHACRLCIADECQSATSSD